MSQPVADIRINNIRLSSPEVNTLITILDSIRQVGSFHLSKNEVELAKIDRQNVLALLKMYQD